MSDTLENSGTTYDPRPSGVTLLAALLACVLVALAPFSVWFELGPPMVEGILPTHAMPFADLSDLPALALLCVVAWQRWRARRSSHASPCAPLRFTWLPVALAGLAFITAPWALSPPLAVYAASRWLLAAAVGLALVRSGVAPRWLATTLLLALVPHALVGLVQITVQGPIGLPAEFAPPPSAEGANVIDLESGPWLRAYGVTCHPNVLGGFIATALILSAPLLGRVWARASWWILWAGLLATFSRASLLSVALTLPIAGVWLAGQCSRLRRPLLQSVLGAAAVVVAFVALFPEQVATRIAPLLVRVPGVASLIAEVAPLERLSLSNRDVMAEVALGTIAQRPVSGVGAGNFPIAMRDARTPIEPDYVHNVPLLLASEVGSLGGGLWTAAWIAAALLLAVRWRSLSAWSVVSLAAWSAIGVIALFDHARWSFQMGRLLTVTVLAMIDLALYSQRIQAPSTFQLPSQQGGDRAQEDA
jgi:hypothetical protein